MKEKDIPERCRDCQWMQEWILPVNGEKEFSCMGGRIPDWELHCNRYKKRKEECGDDSCPI